MSESESVKALRAIVERLRAETRASRTTIRVDCPALGVDVETVLVESRGAGVRGLEGQRTPRVRDGAAARWLVVNRRVFVMADCLKPWAPEVAPEPYVVDLYGIRAEMVAGVFRGDAMIGIVSVHYTAGPRDWRDDEIAAIERACRDVLAVLDALEEGLAVSRPA